MIRCIVIDDEQHAVDLLASHISKIKVLDMQFTTTDPIAAFQYVQQNETDLIFLDIQMAELNGIQFLKLLAGKSGVILTTAYPEFALDGYEHDIIDYLLKPILFDRFLKAVQKAITQLNHTPSDKIISKEGAVMNDDDYMYVRTDTRNKIVRVLLKEIEYVEGMGNYISIQTTSSRIITLLTMKEFEEKLPAHRFIRIHNSYLVPFNKITTIEGNQLSIGKHQLPIGDTYRKLFLQAIDTRILNSKKNK